MNPAIRDVAFLEMLQGSLASGIVETRGCWRTPPGYGQLDGYGGMRNKCRSVFSSTQYRHVGGRDGTDFFVKMRYS